MQKLLFCFSLLFLVFPVLAKEKAVVQKIIDGDTIRVDLNGESVSVRLIGIDTPESKVNKRAYTQAKRSKKDVNEIVALGKAVKSFVKKSLRKGDTVYLDYDVSPRDKYDRHLCYVFLKNGNMLNEQIIGQGYAVPLTIPPNVKYKSRFLKAYRNARKKKLGLWKE